MQTAIGAAIGFLGGYLWVTSRGEALAEVVGIICAIVGALIGLGIQLSQKREGDAPAVPPKPNPISGPLGAKKRTEIRWQKVVPLIQEFQQHLSPAISRLEISPANDRSWSDEQYANQKATGIFDGCGVYLIFDSKEQLVYVGVATNRFEDRVWAHDDSLDRRWTDVIRFENRHDFLALALECFLIARLSPPGNTQHCVKKGVA